MSRLWDLISFRPSFAEGQQTDKVTWAEDLVDDLLDVIQIHANGPRDVPNLE